MQQNHLFVVDIALEVKTLLKLMKLTQITYTTLNVAISSIL